MYALGVRSWLCGRLKWRRHPSFVQDGVKHRKERPTRRYSQRLSLVGGERRCEEVPLSYVSAQFPERLKLLETLADANNLPSPKQLEDFWFTLQQGSKVVRLTPGPPANK